MALVRASTAAFTAASSSDFANWCSFRGLANLVWRRTPCASLHDLALHLLAGGTGTRAVDADLTWLFGWACDGLGSTLLAQRLRLAVWRSAEGPLHRLLRLGALCRTGFGFLRQYGYAPSRQRTRHQQPSQNPASPRHCPTPIILVTSATPSTVAGPARVCFILRDHYDHY